MLANGGWDLTLTLLTWTIWRTHTNASKWRMGFNSAFKGLTQFVKCIKLPPILNFVEICLVVRRIEYTVGRTGMFYVQFLRTPSSSS